MLGLCAVLLLVGLVGDGLVMGLVVKGPNGTCDVHVCTVRVYEIMTVYFYSCCYVCWYYFDCWTCVVED